MSDLISRSEILKKFSVNSNGYKIPEYDIDNFPVTIPLREVKEIIRKEPIVRDKEIRNKAIEEFVNKVFEQFTALEIEDSYATVTECKMILREIAEQVKEVNNNG